MLYNYIKIAWRNLMKRKFYTSVTIFGLSVGMTFAFLIGSYVWGELRVNGDLRNSDSQYILKSKWKKPDMGMEITAISPLSKALKEHYPALVENYYRYDAITSTVSKGEKHFKEGIVIGDSTLLKMYGFPLLDGNAATALDNPNSIVIPKRVAMKFFGKTDVVGQTLMLDSFSGDKRAFMVSAVLADLPYNSIADLVNKETPIFMPPGSMAFFGRGNLENWANAFIVNFIELKPGVDKEALTKPIRQLLATNTTPNIHNNLEIELVPLRQFYREANDGLVQKTIITLTLVGLFILVMAIVNFVNISIGNAGSRLKEIGVRKVLGSRKVQIIRQFLAESILISFMAMCISIVLYQAFRSIFGGILGKEIASVFDFLPYFLLSGIGIALFTGLLAGIYPAFVLSSLPSVDSMKGKLRSVKENVFFRRSLITSQFTIALFVFIAAAVISRQVDFFFNKDLGYSKSFVFSVTAPRDWSPEGVRKMEVVRNEIMRLPDVKAASVSYEIPNGRTGFSAPVYRMGQDSAQAIFVPNLQTDEKFAATYGISLVAGKYFQSEGELADPAKTVLNESAVKALGFSNAAAALGQKLHYVGSPQMLTVAGVVKDFHFESMHKAIRPLIFVPVKSTNNYRYFSFKVSSDNLSRSVASIEQKWRQLLPDAPFEYTFMDDALAELYQSEIRLQKASQVATVLAVIIVLLGVLGVVSLNVSRRTKELGIRKVLGASVASIMALFVKEFLFILGFAMLVSFPLVALGMNKWLKNYAYRISLSWTDFAQVSFFFALFVAALITLQTYKTAMKNPVQSLKSD
jgi:putative ABC transport system permease protein